MHIKTRNVNTAFVALVEFFYKTADTGGMDIPCTDGAAERIEVARRKSRNGPVLMIDEPLTVTYTRPRERVLFNSKRDANPFFHLYEALYLLTGGDRIAPLAYYAKQMREYSDDGVRQNGAYGYRWRNYAAPRAMAKAGDELINPPGSYDLRTRIDQLDVLAAHLRRDPDTRRAVLSMWNVEDDLLKIDGPRKSKDVCCNLSVMLSTRLIAEGEKFTRAGVPMKGVDVRALDMTVTNRSNDLVWGMLGANYVQFTVLQEYMAARCGFVVGFYHHVTNNCHVYTEGLSGFKPEYWLSEYDSFATDRIDYRGDGATPARVKDAFAVSRDNFWMPTPLLEDAGTFDSEVETLCDDFDGAKPFVGHSFREPFLDRVAQPMFIAHAKYKAGDMKGAAEWANRVESADWRLAALQWLDKRAAKAKALQGGDE